MQNDKNCILLFYFKRFLGHILAKAYSITYTPTIQAPVGKFKKKENNNPNIKQITDISTESTTNPLKLFVNFLAIIAGKTIKLEISKVPIIRIPSTTTTAVINEIKNW